MSPTYRDAEFAEVARTAGLLASEYGLASPSAASIRRAVADPELYWRRLQPVSRYLAHIIFWSMFPIAGWAGHIYAADYTHLGWWVNEEGRMVELLLLIIQDLYSRYIVAWGTLTHRPRASDFRLFLVALAEAGILSEILRVDNERCFTAAANEAFLNFRGTELQKTPPGKPQFNGQLESLNGHTKAPLPVEAPDRDRAACEDRIATAISDYHQATSEATKTTPAVLAAGLTPYSVIIHV